MIPKINFIRKRKTRNPCEGCFLHKERCVCESIPSFNLKTKITLIIHAKELKHTTNTGQIALKALANSEMRVRGDEHKALNLSDLLSPHYRTFLFYPAESALELNSDLVNESDIPIQLIVPDGTWRQARKVHTRHPELKNIQRVMIKTPNPNKLHMRKETTENGMATLQAIACALGIIEGENVKTALMKCYLEKVTATLKARGQWSDLVK